jgi:hypothetical protein
MWRIAVFIRHKYSKAKILLDISGLDLYFSPRFLENSLNMALFWMLRFNQIINNDTVHWFRDLQRLNNTGLDLSCQYNQCSMSIFYERRSQKCNKDWHLDCLFVCFWDLHAQKLLVERWWNWPQTSSGLIYFTFIFFFLSTFLILFKILNINVIDKISYQQQKDEEKQRCEREQKIFEIVFDCPPKCLHTDLRASKFQRWN